MLSTEITNRVTATTLENRSVIWIGSSFYSEFHKSYSAIRDNFEIKLATNIATVIGWAKSPEFNPPTLIVLAEDYPRQFVDSELREISSLWPLTQLVQVVNDWCEGDPRSRFAQPSVIRILRDEFPFWIDRAMQQHANHLAPSWLHPPASSVEHHWLEQNPLASNNRAHFCKDKPAQKLISHIAALSHSLEDRIALADSLGSIGFCDDKNLNPSPSTLLFLDFLKRNDNQEQSPLDQPDLIIANSHNGLERELDIYQFLRSHWPSASWLFLINFPRSRDLELLRDWSKSRVLPKPCSLAMLETALNGFTH